MLGYFHEDSVLAQCAHGDVDQLLISVPLDYGYHFLGDGGLSLEGECGVAVGVVEDHLVHFDGDGRHLLHSLLFLLELPQPGGEKLFVLLHHGVLVPEIACVENGAHVALEKDHGGTRDVLGVEKGELDVQFLGDEGESVGLVVVIGVY